MLQRRRLAAIGIGDNDDGIKNANEDDVNLIQKIQGPERRTDRTGTITYGVSTVSGYTTPSYGET